MWSVALLCAFGIWLPLCLCRISSDTGESPLSRDKTFLLHGTTVFEPPFVYSESGPYTGYCVDVVKVIAAEVGFNYSLQQAPDGQIGTVQQLNGVFRELLREADFAIGDISRNWLNDERKAQSAGVLFTTAIFTSTLSVLLSKNLLQEISQNKTKECVRKLNRLNEQKNASHGVWSFRCSEHVTLDDIFAIPALNRLVIQHSAVHEYFKQKEETRIPEVLLVEKSSMIGYGLEKLKTGPYVLIDETKFTSYYADQNCELELIEANSRFNDGLSNVKIDETLPAPALSRVNFRNEIALAMSASLVKQIKRTMKRDLLADFNMAIRRMQYKGKLQELQNKHWRKQCRRASLNTANTASVHLLVLALASFACMWSALGSTLP